MTVLEKAMTGDSKAIEQYFFKKDGSCRSDVEADIVFNQTLHYTERLRRIAVIREAQSFQRKATRTVKTRVSHIPFESRINEGDLLHARALGIRIA